MNDKGNDEPKIAGSEGERESPPMNALPSIVTIGVYGFDEAGFFGALKSAGVDTFCDIRWRRGVRGSEYVFANRARLEKRLGEMGIRYLHFRKLAPSPETRRRQTEADKARGEAKRQRSTLSEAFISGYRAECLAGFESRRFVEHLGSEARTVALFCVEREPTACHRSLLAERLRDELGMEVLHLKPGPAA